MRKLQIRIYPDKILRKKAATVKNIKDQERKLVTLMIETMRASDGIGLAAPQVGISKRLIVIEDVENKNNGLPYVFFNPKILKKKGRCSFCEGCLSVADVTSDISRPESVLVEALDQDGKRVKIDTDGLLARILQHEIDHLDGILFIDRVGFLKRKRILNKISSKVCTKL